MTDHGERGERGATGRRGETGETGQVGETGQAGTTGDTGRTGAAGTAGEPGETGAQGVTGAAGRQGEAGVSGRQGEAGQAGLRGEKGQRGSAPLSRAQALVVLAVVVVAFASMGLLFQRQSGAIRDNQTRIARVQWDQCNLQHDAAVRQVTLIDSAIAAERRKGPAADTKRIRDLEQFKPAVVDCGRRP